MLRRRALLQNCGKSLIFGCLSAARRAVAVAGNRSAAVSFVTHIKICLYGLYDGGTRMNDLLAGLRAAAEPTRLRLLLLCSRGELTVSELTQVLGQSQPRVSRHLKLLCEAGLLDRFREGSWVFYRLSDRAAAGGRLARLLVELLPASDASVVLDLERLAAIKRARAAVAAAYFRDNAARWDQIRSLHVDEKEVERTLGALLPAQGIRDLLDIGTGTARMLELFGPRVERAVGIDLSREMLAVARVNLERAGLTNCSVRHGDMYQLPFAGASFDAVLIHQVLHYAERPAAAIAEAARVLRPSGRLVVIDFAPHELEFLRTEHAHRRLGFGDAEIAEWCAAAGLEPDRVQHLPGTKLTVSIWPARRPAAAPADAREPAEEPRHASAAPTAAPAAALQPSTFGV
jgi:ArsR family transcriptional regulator